MVPGGRRLFHSWFFFLLPKDSTPRSRGKSRFYLIPLGLQSFLPQKYPQLDYSGALCGSLQEQGPHSAACSAVRQG